MGGGAHDFVIVVPVADRPLQLAACLDSLFALLRQHPYPGGVSVLLAEDSRDPDNVARHRELAADCSRRGIPAHHLGQEEQRALLEALTPQLRARLTGVLGRADLPSFHHKGASLTRNLACLWLMRLQRDGGRRLFWFVDSDQTFRVESSTPAGERWAFVPDYLGWLDRIFGETDTCVLTGKVVGDPPVSPAVMAGTLLDDVLACLGELTQRAPRTPCAFHEGPVGQNGEAAYHDMPELFGFRPTEAAWRYRCELDGPHDHAACLAGFANRLARFFDGEHPTRRSHYTPEDPLSSLRPARTIYTGNYVLDAHDLAWFIPFADLGLRMAGPTLGRILRAELGGRFASANLPLLHRRTLEGMGRAEFRPGIERGGQRVDLAGEFERQYFGDVMLFAVERLTARGYPLVPVDGRAIAQAVEETESDLQVRYRAKQAEVCERLERLEAAFSGPDRWWQTEPGLADARAAFRLFITNLRENFGEGARAWQLIGSAAHRAARKTAIAAAIARYPDERAAWLELSTCGGAHRGS